MCFLVPKVYCMLIEVHTPDIVMLYTDTKIDLFHLKHLQVNCLSLDWSAYSPLRITEARVSDLD